FLKSRDFREIKRIFSLFLFLHLIDVEISLNSSFKKASGIVFMIRRIKNTKCEKDFLIIS
ncbi:MAG: hypothetical protein ACFFDT_30520, partial [Candidatus Hodarchaeota archaeon]